MNLTRSSVKPPPVPVSHPSAQRSGGQRRRVAPESEVQSIPAAPRFSDPAAAARSESGASALSDNPFASLEQETTRSFQVSDELLQQARENAAVSNGATRAYEVPAELLEMARRKKLARAAASLKPAASPTPPKDEPAEREVDVSEVTQTGPRLAFAELSDEDRAWVESALSPPPQSEPKSEKIEQSEVRPLQLPRVAPKKNRTARWLLVSLCLVAISAVAIQYARLSSDSRFPRSLGWDNDTSLGGLLSIFEPRAGSER